MQKKISAKEDSHDEKTNNMLRALRERFNAMTNNKRESYFEMARRSLPPSCHHDQPVLLMTAMQLFYQEEMTRGPL